MHGGLSADRDRQQEQEQYDTRCVIYTLRCGKRLPLPRPTSFLTFLHPSSPLSPPSLPFSIPYFSFVHPFISHILNFSKNRTPTKFSILLQQILAIRYNNHGVFFTHWIGLDAEFPINVELQEVEERRFPSPNYPT